MARANVPTSAAERALELLRAELRDHADWRRGYLDVLAADPETKGLVQALMRSGLVSRVYERWWRPSLARAAKGVLGPGMGDERRIARSLLELEPGDRALDVACGPGNFSRDFARVVGIKGLVVGIDASRPMLEQAVHDTRRAGIDNLAFVHGDAVTLPFRDRTFDNVCCFAALHLFAEPMEALSNMGRVLATGGRIAIFTTCASRSEPLRTLESVVGGQSGIKVFELEEIADALRERGFGQIRRQVTGFTQFVGGKLEAR